MLTQTLADRAWQSVAREWLHAASGSLAAVLSRHGLLPTAGSAFFQWWQDARAQAVHVALAKQGILTRLFDAPASLRFGLPADASALQRLERALGTLNLEDSSP